MDNLEEAIELAHRIYDQGSRKVMVATYSGFAESRTRRHLQLQMDKNNELYVRVHKRGSRVIHLKDMAGARIVRAKVDGAKIELPVFFENL